MQNVYLESGNRSISLGTIKSDALGVMVELVSSQKSVEH